MSDLASEGSDPEQHERRMNQLESKKADLLERMRELSETWDQICAQDIQGEIKALAARKEELAQKVESLEEALIKANELDEELSSLRDAIAAAEQGIIGTKASISSKQNELEEINSSIRDLQASAILPINEECDKVDEGDEDISAQNIDQEQYKAQSDMINRQIEELRDLQLKEAQLSSQVKSAQVQVDNLKKKTDDAAEIPNGEPLIAREISLGAETLLATKQLRDEMEQQLEVLKLMDEIAAQKRRLNIEKVSISALTTELERASSTSSYTKSPSAEKLGLTAGPPKPKLPSRRSGTMSMQRPMRLQGQPGHSESIGSTLRLRAGTMVRPRQVDRSPNSDMMRQGATPNEDDFNFSNTRSRQRSSTMARY